MRDVEEGEEGAEMSGLYMRIMRSCVRVNVIVIFMDARV